MLRCRDCPRSAINDHRSLSEGFNRTNIHGTHVPVEGPSTASTGDNRNDYQIDSAIISARHLRILQQMIA
jgi:hypothetical protein